MQRVGNTGRTDNTVAPRRARVVALAASVGALLALGACTSTTGGNGAAGNGAGTAQSPAAHDSVSTPVADPTTSAPALPAVIETPAARSGLNPAKPVTVGVQNGKLTSVTMVNPEGKHVHGAMSADGTSWHNTEDLGYSRSYRIVAQGVNADGVPVRKSARVTTLTPDNQTMPYLQRIGGAALGSGSTYGVAIVPVVHFDESIPNEAAAERNLHVTTTPHVDGSWYWSDSQNAHWRPQHYWPSGTKVTVTADVYGKNLGNGLYGQSDVTTSFKVGRRQVTIAYDTAPKSVNKVRVYNAAGRVIRTMNTSMGEHSGEYVNGNWINFYTLDGTYTVLDHEQPAKMCSATYGLPANAPGGYPCEDIYNATKISTDGIYLHELLTTIWAQDEGQDVSHGCLNLNADNSLWFFKHSMVGDPVVIHGNKHAPTLQVNEGGDWTVPWSKWVKGSALS